MDAAGESTKEVLMDASPTSSSTSVVDIGRQGSESHDGGRELSATPGWTSATHEPLADGGIGERKNNKIIKGMISIRKPSEHAYAEEFQGETPPDDDAFQPMVAIVKEALDSLGINYVVSMPKWDDEYQLSFQICVTALEGEAFDDSRDWWQIEQSFKESDSIFYEVYWRDCVKILSTRYKQEGHNIQLWLELEESPEDLDKILQLRMLVSKMADYFFLDSGTGNSWEHVYARKTCYCGFRDNEPNVEEVKFMVADTLIAVNSYYPDIMAILYPEYCNPNEA